MSIETPPAQFSAHCEFAPTGILCWQTLDDGGKLDALIYKPADWAQTDARKTMVFFFGGGWRQGSPWQFAPYAAHLSRQGWVVILPEYRVRSIHGTTPIDACLDAGAFMRWVAGNAVQLGVDMTRLFAGGGSAGAHLAASLPVTQAIDRTVEPSPVPRGLVLFNPAANFSHPDGIGRRTDTGAAFGVTLEEFLAVDPHAHATADYPPTLIMHGAADEIVPVSAVEAFAMRLQSLGVSVHLVVFEGRQHGFFNPGRSQDDYEATLIHMDDFLGGLASD